MRLAALTASVAGRADKISIIFKIARITILAACKSAINAICAIINAAIFDNLDTEATLDCIQNRLRCKASLAAETDTGIRTETGGTAFETELQETEISIIIIAIGQSFIIKKIAGAIAISIISNFRTVADVSTMRTVGCIVAE